MVVIGLLMVVAAFAEALFIRGALDLTVAFIPGSAKFVYTTSISLALLYAHNPVYSPPSAHSGGVISCAC